MEVVSCDSHMTLCILYVNKCGWFVHVNLHVSCVHVCACVCLCERCACLCVSDVPVWGVSMIMCARCVCLCVVCVQDVSVIV